MSDFKKYSNMLWCDLKSNTERYEFIKCGRAHHSGVIAKAIESDLLKAYETLANETNKQISIKL